MRKNAILGLGSVLVLLLVLAGNAEGQGGFGGGFGGGGGFVFRERMKRDRPADYNLLQKVKQSEIVVIRGSYDHVETVLSFVGVPHLTIDPEDLDQAELNAGQLLLINCPGQISEGAIQKVRKFVNAGGFLFTTDWSLQNVLEKAFPGFVEYTRKPTVDDVVEVRVLKEDNHFLQHVKSSRDSPKWWLERSSYPIRVLSRQQVQVLMSSEEMKRKYGEAPIAITFTYGDGQVLHIVSHYYLQRTETRTGWEKEKGTKFAKELGIKLTPESRAALEGTTAGEARDAYSASQLSANVIVAKQKLNARLQKLYSHQSIQDTILRISPASNSGKAGELKKGTPVKPLQKGGEWWRVRSFLGDEGWVRSESLIARPAR